MKFLVVILLLNFRFYFPRGKPALHSQIENTIARITGAFQSLPNHQATKGQFHTITAVRSLVINHYCFSCSRKSLTQFVNSYSTGLRIAIVLESAIILSSQR